MSRRCQVTGKRPLSGNHVSHANNKTKRKQFPNLKVRRIMIQDLGRSVKIKLSTKALRTMNKIGIKALLKKNRLRIKDFT